MAKSNPGAGISAAPTRGAMGGAVKLGNSQSFAPRLASDLASATPRSKTPAARGNSTREAPEIITGGPATMDQSEL